MDLYDVTGATWRADNAVNWKRRAAVLFVALCVLCGAVAPAGAQPALSVKLVSLTSPVRHGADASIVVATSAGAGCTIAVYYKSGRSRAQGLVPKTADAFGRVAWIWRVGTQTTPGVWPIVVNCSLGTRSGTLKTVLNVI